MGDPVQKTNEVSYKVIKAFCKRFTTFRSFAYSTHINFLSQQNLSIFKDATFCKRSAVHYGYWNDPYLEAMLPWSSSNFGGEARKAPEIHLGYFTRVRGLWTLIDRIVSLCLQSDCNYQIINLGAGYDTLYWRLKESVAGKVINILRYKSY